MKETYIDEKDLNMYRIVPAPPKWDLQEYIVNCLKEKDNRYLAWFLHYYEKTLNNNVQEYMRKLFMPEHFADMKQAYIAGLLKSFKNYDIEQGAPFILFKERYVEGEILDYVRSMRTGFTAQSIAEYAKLRKAMAIWDKYERDYSDETLIKVADELEETVENTKEILLGGLLNENRIDLYQQYTGDDGEESTEEAHSDSSSDTYTLFMKRSCIPGCGKHTKNWSTPNGKCYLKGVAFALNAIVCFIWIMMTSTNTAIPRRNPLSR